MDGQVCIKFGVVQGVDNNVVKQRGILCILSIFSRQKKGYFFFVFFVFKKFFFAIVKSKICHIYHEDKHGFNIFFWIRSEQIGSKWIKLETFRSFLCDSQIQIRHILTWESFLAEEIHKRILWFCLFSGSGVPWKLYPSWVGRHWYGFSNQ